MCLYVAVCQAACHACAQPHVKGFGFQGGGWGRGKDGSGGGREGFYLEIETREAVPYDVAKEVVLCRSMYAVFRSSSIQSQF